MSINKKTMNIIFIIVGVVLVGWFLYSWLPVRNIEEPKYTVVSEASGYEIREYASYIVAETIVSGAENKDEVARKGFPIIAGYIFGDNTKKDKIAMTVPVNTEESTSEKIAMTAPVNTEKIAMTVPVNTEKVQESNTYKISFVMPSKYTLETLPEPNDKRVELREVPARKVAVRRFSWTTSESAFKKHETELLEALRRDDIETVGAVNVARYNTPWTIPFMLRSEVQIEVK
ncbi:MAG: heme-binding protein [Candidatus Parcubacteria bacterium]|nr:heme-binding protein [Candidatus Parcubacteria bacterium]